MTNTNIAEHLKTDERGPDIFRAARNNDLAELTAALSAGQRLDTIEPDQLMTPVHVAAARTSNDFLMAASQHESFDPLVRDANGRTAFDHAFAHANHDGMTLLNREMDARLFAEEDGEIDYSDNEPSEFHQMLLE